MNDNPIDLKSLMEALERCTDENAHCILCPYYEKGGNCTTRLITDANLALHKLDEELEKVRSEHE